VGRQAAHIAGLRVCEGATKKCLPFPPRVPRSRPSSHCKSGIRPRPGLRRQVPRGGRLPAEGHGVFGSRARRVLAKVKRAMVEGQARMSRGPVPAARVASIVALSIAAACGRKTFGGGNTATRSGAAVGGSRASSGGPDVGGSSGVSGSGATSSGGGVSGSRSAANSTSSGTSSGIGATDSGSAAGPTLFECPMNCSPLGLCCLTLVGADVQGTCASLASGCSSAAATIACKASHDCNGQICCIIPAARDGPASSHCAATCPPEHIACGVDADCPTSGGRGNCTYLAGTPEAVFGVCRTANVGRREP